MSESNQQDYEKKAAQYEADIAQYKAENLDLRKTNAELRDKAILALSSVATGWLITIHKGSDMPAFAGWALVAFGVATFSILLGYAFVEKCAWVWNPEILASDENPNRKIKIGWWCQKIALGLNYIAMAGALCGMIFLAAWQLGWDACWVYIGCAVVFCAMIILFGLGGFQQKGKTKWISTK